MLAPHGWGVKFAWLRTDVATATSMPAPALGTARRDALEEKAPLLATPFRILCGQRRSVGFAVLALAFAVTVGRVLWRRSARRRFGAVAKQGCGGANGNRRCCRLRGLGTGRRLRVDLRRSAAAADGRLDGWCRRDCMFPRFASRNGCRPGFRCFRSGRPGLCYRRSGCDRPGLGDGRPCGKRLAFRRRPGSGRLGWYWLARHRCLWRGRGCGCCRRRAGCRAIRRRSPGCRL